jgi:ABC-type glutathione transport system ATPase component
MGDAQVLPARGHPPVVVSQGLCPGRRWGSFSIQPHETLSLVGESGCGKITTAKLITRREEVTAGTIFYEGQEVQHVKGRARRRH